MQGSRRLDYKKRARGKQETLTPLFGQPHKTGCTPCLDPKERTYGVKGEKNGDFILSSEASKQEWEQGRITKFLRGK